VNIRSHPHPKEARGQKSAALCPWHPIFSFFQPSALVPDLLVDLSTPKILPQTDQTPQYLFNRLPS
jgi:hypothetical protein